jgi:hypothetical protein
MQKRHIERRKKKILKSFSCCGFKFVSYSVISHSPSHFMLLLPLKSGGLTNLFQCAIMLVQIGLSRADRFALVTPQMLTEKRSNFALWAFLFCYVVY